MLFAAGVAIEFRELNPSGVILGSLAGVLVLAALLYLSGVLGFLIGAIGTVLRVSITRGFLTWERYFSWAPWPVFLSLMLGLIVLGVYLVDHLPALTVLVALVPLVMGGTASLAYMYIDWERYEVARGYKSVHNPLKGQELAYHLVRYGHRVGAMLLLSSALGVIGGFALLNEGLAHSFGHSWYTLAGLDGNFADFVAYALINIYGIVDVLDLASHRHFMAVSHINAAFWPASTLLTIYKTFFTVILLQQLFAAVRNLNLLGQTIDDFWSPYEPIHLRARSTLPLYGLSAISPLLLSLRLRGALTKEQREQLPGILADMGPAIVPMLTLHLRDPHPDVRGVAIAALGQLRTSQALALLLHFADDPSDVVRQNLVMALGELGTTGSVAGRQLPPVRLRGGRMRLWLRMRWWWQRQLHVSDPLTAIVGILRRRLTDVAQSVRLQAAHALAKIGPPAAAAAGDLILLIRDGDETVRCAAIEALGHIGVTEEAAQSALVELLADGSAAVRRSAAKALGLLKEAATAAIPALVDTLRDADENVRQTASEAIAAIGTVPEAAMDTLVGGLSNPDNLVRAHTARALGEIGTAAADAAPALVEALGDRNDAVRAEVVEALGKLGPAAADVAVPRIVHALHDPDSWVSALAAEALGAMGESAEEAVPALVRSLGHISSQVRANAAEALGKLGPAAQSVRPALAKAAADPEGSVRCQAVRALGQLGPDAAARPALQAALGDADPQVRAAGAEALSLWHEEGQDVQQELLRLLDDANDEVKVRAAQALPRLVGPQPEVIDRLCKRMQKDDSVWVQGQAAQALGRLGPTAQAAGPALLEAVQTAEASVREQALHALALIQPPEAATAFTAGLKDSSAEIRRMASAGWRRAQSIPDDAVASLVEALRDPELAVRANVAYALSRLDTLPDAAIPLLVECIAAPSNGLRLHAALALQKAATKVDAAVWRSIIDDPNMSVRLIAARALLAETSGRTAVLPVLADALANASAGYRRAALQLIETLADPPEELREVLQVQMEKETDAELRERMQGVLARLKKPETVPESTAPVAETPVLAGAAELPL